jgi:glycerol-3-phosphate acyltransferase PlsY
MKLPVYTPERNRLVRRLWHLGGGSFFPVLSFFMPRVVLLSLLSGACVLALAWETVRFLWPGAVGWLMGYLRPIMKEQEVLRPTGSTYLLLSSLLVFWVVEPKLAALALFFLAVGDPVAATVGERWGTRRIWGKSWQGSLAYLLSCLGVGGLLAVMGLGPGLLLITVGAVAATLIELLPLPVDDNLSIPLFSAGIMALLSWQLA